VAGPDSKKCRVYHAKFEINAGVCILFTPVQASERKLWDVMGIWRPLSDERYKPVKERDGMRRAEKIIWKRLENG